MKNFSTTIVINVMVSSSALGGFILLGLGPSRLFFWACFFALVLKFL